MKTMIKTICIFLLVFAAVFQTTKLWFDSTNHNFFYSFGNKNSSAQINNIQKIIPSRIMVNFGNNKYKVLNVQKDAMVLEASDAAISQTLREGKVILSEKIDWTKILSSRSIIFEYNFVLNSESFSKSYEENANSFSVKVSKFNQISIVFPRTISDSLRVTFIDTESDKCISLQTESFSINENINKYFDNEQISESTDLFYISSKQSGVDIFTSNVFIPQWSKADVLINGIKISNNFLISGMNYIDVFFENPAAIMRGVDIDNNPTFSDEKTVLKYYDNVLEYFNYQTANTVGNNLLYYNYSSAINFMNRDLSLTNSIYMTSAQIEDSRWSFQFEYTINGLPVYFSEETLSKSNMKSAIEIEVQNGVVTKYKRFLVNISLTDEFYEVSTDFLTVINTIITTEGMPAENTFFDDIDLGYYISSDKNRLCWTVNLRNNSYKLRIG